MVYYPSFATPKPVAKPVSKKFSDIAKDKVLKFTETSIGQLQWMADVFGPSSDPNTVSGYLRDNSRIVSENYSDSYKADRAKYAAEAALLAPDDYWGQFKHSVGDAVANPGDTFMAAAGQSVGTLPYVAAGALAAPLKLGMAGARAIGSIGMAMAGIGATRGGSYDSIVGASDEQLASDPRYQKYVDEFGDKAGREKLASEVSSIDENGGSIALSALISGGLGAVGAQPALANAMGVRGAASRIASAAMRDALKTVASRSALSQGARMAVFEGAQEIVDEGSQQYLSNRMAASGGAKIDPMEGVVDSAVQAAIMSGPVSAIAGAEDVSEAKNELKKLREYKKLSDISTRNGFAPLAGVENIETDPADSSDAEPDIHPEVETMFERGLRETAEAVKAGRLTQAEADALSGKMAVVASIANQSITPEGNVPAEFEEQFSVPAPPEQEKTWTKEEAQFALDNGEDVPAKLVEALGLQKTVPTEDSPAIETSTQPVAVATPRLETTASASSVLSPVEATRVDVMNPIELTNGTRLLVDGKPAKIRSIDGDRVYIFHEIGSATLLHSVVRKDVLDDAVNGRATTARDLKGNEFTVSIDSNASGPTENEMREKARNETAAFQRETKRQAAVIRDRALAAVQSLLVEQSATVPSASPKEMSGEEVAGDRDPAENPVSSESAAPAASRPTVVLPNSNWNINPPTYASDLSAGDLVVERDGTEWSVDRNGFLNSGSSSHSLMSKRAQEIVSDSSAIKKAARIGNSISMIPAAESPTPISSPKLERVARNTRVFVDGQWGTVLGTYGKTTRIVLDDGTDWNYDYDAVKAGGPDIKRKAKQNPPKGSEPDPNFRASDEDSSSVDISVKQNWNGNSPEENRELIKLAVISDASYKQLLVSAAEEKVAASQNRSRDNISNAPRTAYEAAKDAMVQKQSDKEQAGLAEVRGKSADEIAKLRHAVRRPIANTNGLFVINPFGDVSESVMNFLSKRAGYANALKALHDRMLQIAGLKVGLNSTFGGISLNNTVNGTSFQIPGQRGRTIFINMLSAFRYSENEEAKAKAAGKTVRPNNALMHIIETMAHEIAHSVREDDPHGPLHKAEMDRIIGLMTPEVTNELVKILSPMLHGTGNTSQFHTQMREHYQTYLKDFSNSLLKARQRIVNLVANADSEAGTPRPRKGLSEKELQKRESLGTRATLDNTTIVGRATSDTAWRDPKKSDRMREEEARRTRGLEQNRVKNEELSRQNRLREATGISDPIAEFLKEDTHGRDRTNWKNDPDSPEAAADGNDGGRRGGEGGTDLSSGEGDRREGGVSGSSEYASSGVASGPGLAGRSSGVGVPTRLDAPTFEVSTGGRLDLSEAERSRRAAEMSSSANSHRLKTKDELALEKSNKILGVTGPSRTEMSFVELSDEGDRMVDLIAHSGDPEVVAYATQRKWLIAREMIRREFRASDETPDDMFDTSSEGLANDPSLDESAGFTTPDATQDLKDALSARAARPVRRTDSGPGLAPLEVRPRRSDADVRPFGIWKKLEYTFLDKYNRVKEIMGEHLAELAVQVTPKTADAIHMIHETIVRPIAKTLGDAGINMADFEIWLVAANVVDKRGATVEARGGAIPFTGGIEEAQRLYDKHKDNPAYKKAHAYVKQLSHFDRYYLTKSGLETKEAVAKALEAMGESYVPWKKSEAMEGYGPDLVGGIEITGHGLFFSEGMKEMPFSPISTLIEKMNRNIVRANHNEVLQTMARFISDNPAVGWEVVKEEDVPPGTDRNNMISFRDSNSVPSMIVIKSDPHLARQIKGIEAGSMHRFIMAMAGFTHTYARLSTTMNFPIFPIRNFLRDVPLGLARAYVLNDPGTVTHLVKNLGAALKGVYAVAGDSGKVPDPGDNSVQAYWMRRALQMKRMGATVSFTSLPAAEEIKSHFSSDMKKYEKSISGRARMMASQFADGVIRMNETIETGLRLAYFDKLMLDAESKVQSTDMTGKKHPEDLLAPATISQISRKTRELTADFQQKGEIATWMGALYPFFNASLRGGKAVADLFVELGRGNKKAAKLFASLVAIGLMEDLLNSILSGDDDDDGITNYDSQKEWRRRQSFTVPIAGTQKSIIMPMTYGLSVPMNLGKLMGSASRGRTDATAFATEMAMAVFESTDPLGGSATFMQDASPLFLDWFVQVAENKNWDGEKIYPERFPGQEWIPNSGIANKDDSAMAKTIAEGINYATGGDRLNKGMLSKTPFGDITPYPGALDAFAQWIGGGIGRVIYNTVGTAKAAVEGKPIERVPLVSAFVSSPQKSFAVGRFYEQYKGLKAIKSQLSTVKADARRESLVERFPEREKAINMMTPSELEKVMPSIKDNPELKERIEKLQLDRLKLLPMYDAAAKKIKNIEMSGSPDSPERVQEIVRALNKRYVAMYNAR